jgi:hypothetical protein
MQEYSSMNLDVSVARFAPMRRLLSGEDEDYLVSQGLRREASRLRAHHRKLFFRFVTMLEKDFNTVHEARKAAMAGNWDFEALLKERAAASYCLWAMRAAGVMHFAHVPQAARIVDQQCQRFSEFMVQPMPQAVPLR